jgi:hypothetical protein
LSRGSNLCDAYTRREKPELLPIVELDTHRRPHREYGTILEPQLGIIGWTTAGKFAG